MPLGSITITASGAEQRAQRSSLAASARAWASRSVMSSPVITRR
jgi:hypothetical protein